MPDESRNRLPEGKDLASFVNLATLYRGTLGWSYHLDPPVGIQIPACMFYFAHLEQNRMRLFPELALDAEESASRRSWTYEVQLPRLCPGTRLSWLRQSCYLAEHTASGCCTLGQALANAGEGGEPGGMNLLSLQHTYEPVRCSLVSTLTNWTGFLLRLMTSCSLGLLEAGNLSRAGVKVTIQCPDLAGCTNQGDIHG